MKRWMEALFAVIVVVCCAGVAFAEDSAEHRPLEGSITVFSEGQSLLFQDIFPGMSKAEAEAAGLTFLGEPEYVVQGSEDMLASSAYAVDSSVISVSLETAAISSAVVQFTEERLSGITMDISDADGARVIMNALESELGEPQNTQTMDNGRGTSTLYSWEIRTENILFKIGMIYRCNEKGVTTAANVQVNCLPRDLFPSLF